MVSTDPSSSWDMGLSLSDAAILCMFAVWHTAVFTALNIPMCACLCHGQAILRAQAQKIFTKYLLSFSIEEDRKH